MTAVAERAGYHTTPELSFFLIYSCKCVSGRNNTVKLSSGFSGVTSSFSVGGPGSSLIAASGGIKVSQLPSAFQSLQRSKNTVSRVLMEVSIPFPPFDFAIPSKRYPFSLYHSRTIV